MAGMALLLGAGGRYVEGLVRADAARTAWNARRAHRLVQAARTLGSQPARVDDAANGAPVAQLVAPAIDLDAIVLEGVDEHVLNAGPGHVPGSAVPGDSGNAVISAHRDRHFNHLDHLVVGDTLVTETETRRVVWRIVARQVIDKDAPALFETRTPTLTLTTCWPMRYVGPAPDRLILTATPK